MQHESKCNYRKWSFAAGLRSSHLNGRVGTYHLNCSPLLAFWVKTDILALLS